jgi:hypothetical protein
MPGFSSILGFVMLILMRNTSFTRSFGVYPFFGVNSASEDMNATIPS